MHNHPDGWLRNLLLNVGNIKYIQIFTIILTLSTCRPIDFDSLSEGFLTDWDNEKKEWIRIEVEPITNLDDWLINGIRYFPNT